MLIQSVAVLQEVAFKDSEQIKTDLQRLLPFGLARVTDDGRADVGAIASALGLAASVVEPATRHDGRGQGSRRRHAERLFRTAAPQLVLAYPTQAAGLTWSAVSAALHHGHVVAVWAPDFDAPWANFAKLAGIFDAAPRMILTPNGPPVRFDVQHLAEALEAAPAILEVRG
ncbi:hypothetical protein [Nannocystis pusilla]|uniref:hypothetical protein n=1 Tax=Nannocystis pusilla TaxID=889268 RepID=UPI003B76B833